MKLYQPRREIIAPREQRDSRHQRGYDHVWERRSKRYRAANPVCVECERGGFMSLTDVVDHKIPVVDRPDLRLDPENWWSLCNLCHNGIKRRMEQYARKAHMIDKLIMWCDDPSTRPAALSQAPRARKAKETMIV